jgi:hypothetical protein
MRYWLLIDGKREGPFPAGECPGKAPAGGETKACPENLDPSIEGNWKPLKALLAHPAAADKPQRFYIRMGPAARGPFPASDIAGLQVFSGLALVCPEGRDPADRRNWAPAKTFEALRSAIAQRPNRPASMDWGPEPSPSSAVKPAPKAAPEDPGSTAPAQKSSWAVPGSVLAAIAVFFLVFLLRKPTEPTESAPARPPEHPIPMVRDAVRVIMPNCLSGNDRRTLVRNASLIMEDGENRIRIPPDGKKIHGEAVFAYNPQTHWLRPLNDDAWRLADIRSACGSVK